MSVSEYCIVDRILDIPFQRAGQGLMMGGYKTSHNDNEVEHALIYQGLIDHPKETINLRINSACYTSDIFGCQRCDCSWQLDQAIDYIQKNNGLIIYHFHHEGRGFGFTNKLKSFEIMKKERKTSWDACVELHSKDDQRSYLSTIKILHDLGIKNINLLSNNPEKKAILEAHDINVHDIIPIVNQDLELREYLKIKRDKLGHFISFEGSDE
tara:strand:- start:370 stop:1002 length:633 start_codon:yes stop_codon:yes gene_type:complete